MSNTTMKSSISPQAESNSNNNTKRSSTTEFAFTSLNRSNSERGGVDTHPYKKGSIIEVIYGVRKVDVNSDLDEDYDDDDDDYDDDEDDDGHNDSSNNDKNANNDEKNGTSINVKNQSKTNQKESEVRLADIIDRDQSDTPNHENPAYRHKYYIHYRGYNRRMDEWVSDPQRIVSPPSIGKKKAKAKAAKEEEERKARKREKKARKEGSYYTNEDGSVSSNKRRKSSSNSNNHDSQSSILASGGRSSSQRKFKTEESSGGGNGNGRISKSNQQSNHNTDISTGRQRRKSSRGAATATTNNLDDNELSKSNQEKLLTRSSSTTNGVVTTLLPDQVNLKDKVVTVAARELDEHEGLDEASLREHEEVTKVKNVSEVELGRYRMNAWYFSPIPKELFQNGSTAVEVLYVCEFSLKFFSRKEELLRFQCKDLPRNKRHPPGNEIYRNGKLSMFEIDGFEERMYCQNLCFIAKLFLDHKTLYFDVDPFLFYVLCEVDERGFHPVGYYSKEKYSDVGFNLACILTFPCHQRKGYGRFLIDFSYELSKKEEKVGSPEKPMSDLGQQAYKPYWTSTIVDFLLNQSDHDGSMSIMEISKRTSIMAEDIVFTLNVLGLLKYINGVYFIAAEKGLLNQLAGKHPLKHPRVDPLKLHWSPYLSDVKRDKFSIHSKKPRPEEGSSRDTPIFSK